MSKAEILCILLWIYSSTPSFVHDGKLITSPGGARSFDASMYLAEFLYGKKAADGIAKGMVIDWIVMTIPAVIIPEK